MLRTSIRLIFFCLSAILPVVASAQDGNSAVRADVNDAIRMALHPQAVPDRLNEHRLLPSDADLKPGNAAVVIRRISNEQRAFMTTVVPKIPDLLKLDYDDPQIAAQFPFGSSYRGLARAAYNRDADWNYPLDEEPFWEIRIPDAQSMRTFADRGLKLHCGTLITAGRLGEARECILVQLACARHMARTPILVNRLIAESICQSAIDRLEILLSQPDCPNLYWALAMLPDSIADDQVSLQWEAQGLVRSIPSLGTKIEYPPIGHEDWNGVAETFSNLMVRKMGRGMSIQQGAALQAKLLTLAHKELEQRQGYDKATRDKMLATELIMRWVLMVNDDAHAEIEAAFSLPPPLAIVRLQKQEAKIQQFMKDTSAPVVPFPTTMLTHYLTMHAFDRNVKQLQIIEAVRDHATRAGKLPEKLTDLQLPIPNDPLTGKPFEYRVTNTQAFLSPAEIPGVDNQSQHRKTYRLKIASRKR